MSKIVEITLLPVEHEDEGAIRRKVSKKAKIAHEDLVGYRILKRSLDARKRPVYRCRVEALTRDDQIAEELLIATRYQDVRKAPPIHIIGAGPAGYFAALECLEHGLKPIIFDRGKDVRNRRFDLRAIQQQGIVDPDSNYCFGEGGAGTYSDGKLYTRLKKRRHIEKMLKILVEHGAKADILIDAHPHIGSNKLPPIITNIRHTIERYGGEVHFGHQLTDLHIENQQLRALDFKGLKIPSNLCVLATGHSARDVYRLFLRRGWQIEPKPFAMGVRIEHPQAIIDEIQYSQRPREAQLPAASYTLKASHKERSIFSFCMCPGGLIVPAATAPGELVVNGMSPSRRDSAFANSGFVVQIDPSLLAQNGYEGVMAGLEAQQEVEQHMFLLAGKTQKAPAQRLTDFMRGSASTTLPKHSYIPGLTAARLDVELPPYLREPITEGIRQLGNRIPGFLTSEAIAVGIESRTSAPMTIPRTATMQHPQIDGLYPCGEGAGYAGGIVSAALDGQRVIQALYQNTGS
ncbi:MAG: FAD-binding protein [Saprospiraceae bacterium]|nr:FAD-binding protein [Saprospiraceae bacterium]